MHKNRNSNTLSFNLEKKVIFSIGAVLLAVVFLYIFLVMQSIAYVIEREEIVFKTNAINEKTSELEREYLQRSQLVTEDSAEKIGLYTTQEKVFVQRKTYTLGTISR